MLLRSLSAAICIALLSPHGFAGSPAVAYTEAGKFDSSFNEAIYREGVSAFRAQYGHDLIEQEPESPDEFVSVLTNLARQGRSPIVAVGFSYSNAVTEVAKAYPAINFTLIDAVVDLPNVQSIVFKEHEGSFVVGALAAMKAQGDIIGFVGGMDLPFIRRFGCGYAQGAQYVNEDIKVKVRMVAQDFSGFANEARGELLATELIAGGAEVVYAAAGGSGNGVYRAAAAEPSVFAIGVDSNQNFLHVGTMLTSMVKKVGVAAYGSWVEAENETWRAGVKELGLAEGGVDWALDIFNRNVVTLKEEKAINKIRDKIISGKIQVVDYMTSNQCPVTLLGG